MRRAEKSAPFSLQMTYRARIGQVEVICPNCELFALLPPAPLVKVPLALLMMPGLVKFAWLKMLNNSARNSNFVRSVMAVVFENAKSKIYVPWSAEEIARARDLPALEYPREESSTPECRGAGRWSAALRVAQAIRIEIVVAGIAVKCLANAGV